MTSLSDNQLTLDRITELLPINSKDKFLASIVVKEAIKKLKRKILMFNKNVSEEEWKLNSINIITLFPIINEEFGADLCSEEKGFIKEWAEDDVWDKEEDLK